MYQFQYVTFLLTVGHVIIVVNSSCSNQDDGVSHHRTFERGDPGTLIAPTPTLGVSIEGSLINCTTRCLTDTICSRFVYGVSTGVCKRYKCIPGDYNVAPAGDDVIVYTNHENCFIDGIPDDCNTDLLPDVEDSALNASSAYSHNHAPERARLNTQQIGGKMGAWSADSNKNKNQWIQVEFAKPMYIQAIKTQGRSDFAHWVTNYEMSYSNTDCSSNAFKYYLDQEHKIFDGNTDLNSVVANELPTSVVAKCVRIHPKSWNVIPCLRFDLEGCSAYDASQAIKTHCTTTRNLLPEVNDTALFASSEYHINHGPDRARLNTQKLGNKAGAWCTATTTQANQWIQVTFHEPMYITKIKTQGRSDFAQWVKTYQISYSTGDCTSFTPYYGDRIVHKDFHGNSDQNSVVRNTLTMPVVAKCARLHPKAFYVHTSLRFDLQGCPA